MGYINKITIVKEPKKKNNIEKLKVGIIGSGKMGLLHCGIFNNLDQSRLCSIAENNKIISDVIKRCVPSINIYQDYEQMLENEQLDVVVITTPVFLHKKMIKSAMNYNVHIFTEKPLVINSEECRTILSTPYGKKSMVGYCRRFMATYTMSKNIIESKELGHVVSFKAHLFVSQVFSQGRGWLYTPEMSGGGVLIDLGSHAIDLIHYLFGNIKNVKASGKSIYNKTVEDYVFIDLTLVNNILGTLEVSWSVKNYRVPELYIEIQLERGTITVTEKYVKIFSEADSNSIKKGWNSYYKQNLVKNIPIDIGGPEYTLEDLHFLNCIIKDEKPMCNFFEASKTNFVIDNVYKSIKNNTIEMIQYEV